MSDNAETTDSTPADDPFASLQTRIQNMVDTVNSDVGEDERTAAATSTAKLTGLSDSLNELRAAAAKLAEAAEVVAAREAAEKRDGSPGTS